MTIAKIIFCVGVLAIAGLLGVALGVIDKALEENDDESTT